MKPYTITPAQPTPKVPKKRAKKTQPNIHDNFLSNNPSWEELISKETIARNPGREEWRKRLINTMLMEAEEGDMLEVLDFAFKYKIPDDLLIRWTHEFEDIGAAYLLMKRRIASKRRTGCMRKRLDSYSSFRDIHLLDKQDDEVNKYHYELKRLKDVEEQVKFLFELVRPQTITPKMMEDERKHNQERE